MTLFSDYSVFPAAINRCPSFEVYAGVAFNRLCWLFQVAMKNIGDFLTVLCWVLKMSCLNKLDNLIIIPGICSCATSLVLVGPKNKKYVKRVNKFYGCIHYTLAGQRQSGLQNHLFNPTKSVLMYEKKFKTNSSIWPKSISNVDCEELQYIQGWLGSCEVSQQNMACESARF